MRDPVWISEELVMAIHERQLSEHGGGSGVRDEGMLASALARPKQKAFYGGADVDIPGLAAAYAYGVVRNHPFVDGNKRTAYVLCRTFMVLNGWDIVGSLADRYPVIISLAAGELTEEAFADWLRANARPDQVSEASPEYG
ncbi:type II toxin-antitoxin system death-on-curing family toxin [Natronospira bacteriovora]|uniref:Type II toxin-antitoxin system death-on-curing family toxin n=1 Tax=Natronospira bacteriovora TaxID=3069753 RepID=A0ABU0W4Q8_9GAMM|nr:type II toxin-antitoxin system death-on-curing family toxin [Natronospira sp. AB-CW4]MDQ2069012.1 type II toxin-antitoxin system death-on-curing family toxin [Natronospira sp. AB-CW4]